VSIGSLGIIGSLAGSSLPQRAAETDKAQQQSADQARDAQASERAEQAAGIGQTEEDSEASERDADGRRPWEVSPRARAKGEEPVAEQAVPLRAKDPTGACGGQLDLMG
jgi:hypothetical protein